MRRELKAVLPRMLGYAIVLEAMLAAAVLYWPKFRDNVPGSCSSSPGSSWVASSRRWRRAGPRAT
jgi:hypothetical protein